MTPEQLSLAGRGSSHGEDWNYLGANQSLGVQSYVFQRTPKKVATCRFGVAISALFVSKNVHFVCSQGRAIQKRTDVLSFGTFGGALISVIVSPHAGESSKKALVLETAQSCLLKTISMARTA